MGICLHNYEKISETNDGIRERCTFCRKKIVVKRGIDGSINTRFYRKEHLRDLLQPHGRTAGQFEKVYGTPRHIVPAKSKKQRHEEWQQTQEDAIKYAEKLKKQIREE